MGNLEPVTVLLPLAVLVAAWASYWHHRSEPRMRSPLWLGFNATAIAVFLIASGSLGYRLDKRARFFDGTAWSGTVIWSQVGVGLALVPLAAYGWRRGLRDLDSRAPRRSQRGPSPSESRG